MRSRASFLHIFKSIFWASLPAGARKGNGSGSLRCGRSRAGLFLPDNMFFTCFFTYQKEYKYGKKGFGSR